ncbi:conserved hypothetical protein (plasmid) [Pseudarthrobacter chlorophenolicus A6]|uniref:RDD domain containing protein n=1 Tax=Pseudarthrobacter chlorophenolicus (strain ATCC 700700 / DSM 12829 / CIP 107037 / JCM 12360 / KCTC 9906 / NCIMB 13794 / A6) TaxID=452863 RepID=B8HIA3_PSECP|nr:RDD family protein [Pseudarthrobacter chlorophenolicus]ACL42150.1 conserved hypothetical protein [Pseudarthrobacter chlorophenolicus A6]SDQ14094.1 RDD family protein [Pseudarthrobacter chlorophenolicus]
MTSASAAASAAALVDPSTRKTTLVHHATGRHYVPQGLRRYLLGRALDIAVVVTGVSALAEGMAMAFQSTGLVLQEWQSVTAVGLLLFAVVFLYGGIAGTVGTLGEAATRMRVVDIDNGNTAGFLHGGLRAVGWVLFALLTLMLNGTGETDTRYVAVRRDAGVYQGQSPVAA